MVLKRPTLLRTYLPFAAHLSWALCESTDDQADSSSGLALSKSELCIATLVAIAALLVCLQHAGNDRVKYAMGYARFVLGILSVAMATLYDVLSDLMCLVCYLYLGLPLMSTVVFALIVVAPVVCWLFVRHVRESTLWWHLPFYILQIHVLEGVRMSLLRGRKEFRLVWAAVTETCFEAHYSAILEIYLLSIAPEAFRGRLPLPVPLSPVEVQVLSFIVSVLNLGKVLAIDMDYYGCGRLELVRNQVVMAHRWEKGRRSIEAWPSEVRWVKEYCACVVFEGEEEVEEIPVAWLVGIEPVEGVCHKRRAVRLLFRVAEVSHTTLLMVAFALLCREEGLSIHESNNKLPILMLVVSFAVMLLLVRSSGNTQLNWLFAAMFMVASPPLMFTQFRDIQLWHTAFRLVQFSTMFTIVYVKCGWSNIARRLHQAGYLEWCFFLATVIYLILLPIQYFEELHRYPNRKRSHGLPAEDEDAEVPLEKEVPTLLRAAIVDENIALVQMYSRFLPTEGALQFALERGTAEEVLHELIGDKPAQCDGVLETAVQSNAPHSVLMRLLQCGATPRSAPLQAALERCATSREVLELLAARAEVYKGALQTGAEHDAETTILAALLQLGAEPRCGALEPVLRRREPEEQVLWLLSCRAEPEDGVLNVAAEHGASHTVLLELLRLGATPRDAPLRAALNRPCAKEVAELLHARAELCEGALRRAVKASAPTAVIKLLVGSRADLAYTGDTVQDMSRPLSHYWISASHNTYLMGAQVNGVASADMYTQALRRGCRCVEIDCWDGPGGEPVVTHGYTWTTKVRLEDVLAACREHAFDRSEYPLILSIEMRCSKQQMARCGVLFKSVLGDMLLDACNDELISPERAKRKIIIKSKLAKVSRVVEDEDNKDDYCDGVGTQCSLTVFEDDGGQAPNLVKSGCFGTPSDRAGRLSSKLLKESLSCYNGLVCLPGKKFKAELLNGTGRERHSVCSLTDFKMLELISVHGRQLNEYHRECLTRVYPPGTNVDSSNYDPLFHWLHGVQMVALNFQTADVHMLLNEGLFRHQNRGAGYVLKPAVVQAEEDQEAAVALKLSRVIAVWDAPVSASDDRRLVGAPIELNLSLRVNIHGAAADVASRELLTSTPTSCGLQFTDDVEFNISQPSVAIITFELAVQDTSILRFRSTLFKRPVTVSAYAVSMLRGGTRWIPLWDNMYNEYEHAGLTADISIGPPSKRLVSI